MIVALGHPGRIEEVEIDTAHFKGNYPASATLRAAMVEGAEDLVVASDDWPVILPEATLGPDGVHRFSDEVTSDGKVSHVRLDIFPDGGISRLRLFGRTSE